MSLSTPIIYGEAQPGKRSGHVSVYYKGLFIVYGGFGDKDDKHGDFISSKHIWCYNVEASQWRRVTTKGDHPGMSTGSCASVVNNKMYLFGGYYQNIGQTNKLYALDLDTFTWIDLSMRTRGDQPSARDKFGCWIKYHKIIYFGGFGYPPENVSNVKGEFTFEEFAYGYSVGHGWNNHMYVLNTAKLKWTQPKYSGDIPCPRAAFATTQIGCKGFLFGGRYQDERKNDLYMLDLHSFKWTHLASKEMQPIGRSWHIMKAISKSHLFVYGGFDNIGQALQDVWIYNVQKKEWHELENCSSNLGYFAPRLWHTACNTDSTGELIIFGGCSNSIINDEHTHHTNTIAVFQFSPLKLQRICLDYLLKHFQKYYHSFEDLPRSLQRHIYLRSTAMGLNIDGHGKLVNRCAVM